MLYAREVIDLMAAFPARDWRMIEIVRHVARGTPTCKQQKERIRKGVRRVLECLIEAKVVRCKIGVRGQPAMYRWRAQK